MTRALQHPRTPAEISGAWDSIAAGYDTYVTPTHLWLGNEALERAELARGMKFLDVAAGSGALSIPAARRGAIVVSVDLSPSMVERLGARAREQGITDLDARVMDGHELDLPDDSFDVSGSQFGVMLFPDLPRAVRELVRVTRPGGRVVLVVYGPPTKIDFLTFFLGAVQTAVPGFGGLPSDPPPLEFQVADPRKLSERLEEAGLGEVTVETITETLSFRSGSELWDWVVNSNPIGAGLVADLSEEQKAGVREALEALIRARAGDDETAVLTNPVHIGIGRV